MSDSRDILIACIGNIFLGDDGFGTEAAAALAAAPWPSGETAQVKVVDYGIRGLDLAYALLDPWQAVILVDAVARGGAPGTLYLLQPANASESSSGSSSGIDPHSMDPAAVLATARSMGEITAEVYIVGCEPADFGDELEGRMGLSSEVAAAIPGAVIMVQDLIARLKENVVPVGAAS